MQVWNLIIHLVTFNARSYIACSKTVPFELEILCTIWSTERAWRKSSRFQDLIEVFQFWDGSWILVEWLPKFKSVTSQKNAWRLSLIGCFKTNQLHHNYYDIALTGRQLSHVYTYFQLRGSSYPPTAKRMIAHKCRTPRHSRGAINLEIPTKHHIVSIRQCGMAL